MKHASLTLICFLVLSFVAVPLFSNAQNAAKKKAPRKPNPAMQKVKDVEGLPRVLLVGDSISIGYTVDVRTLLKGKANVHRPLTNCGPTTKGLASLKTWLATGGAEKKWDVIHFNWGLHDLKYMTPDGKLAMQRTDKGAHQQVSPEDYRKNLTELVKTLKATGAKLIWRNTTPVPEGAGGRVVGDAEKYNAIAAGIMKENGISTDDLYSLVKKHPDYMREANVHFTPEGYKALAEQVVTAIEGKLSR